MQINTSFTLYTLQFTIENHIYVTKMIIDYFMTKLVHNFNLFLHQKLVPFVKLESK